jgi:hypothetical protein
MDWHMVQSNKVRWQLNDAINPVDEIVKPKNMRTVVFNRRIKRLKHHEGEFKRKLEAGLMKWMNKTYL